MKHPAVVPLGLQLALGNQLHKGFIRGRPFPLGLLQSGDIVVPPHRGNRNDAITLVYQDQVHEQPRCAPVAVRQYHIETPQGNDS